MIAYLSCPANIRLDIRPTIRYEAVNLAGYPAVFLGTVSLSNRRKD